MGEGIEKGINERKEKVLGFIFKKKNLIIFISLILLLWLAWHIRTANLEQLKDITTNDYTLGYDNDPYLFLRYAKYIVENGKLMEHDDMRYVPLGWDTSRETRLLPYMIAYFHILLSKFKNISVEYSAAMFPVFMFLLTVIAFFLFVREVFKNKKSKDIIALVASGFLVVSPSLLARTTAGIPEKESVSFLFIFLAFYFFLIAWKSEKIRTSVIFAALAGISTAITGLIWRGATYIFLVIGFIVFLEFILNKVDKKRFFSYFVWLLTAAIILFVFFNKRWTIGDLVRSPTSSGLAFMVFFLMLIDFLIFNTKIKEIKIIDKLRKKIPEKAVSIIFFVIIGIVAFTIFFGLNSVPLFLKDLFLSLTRTGTDRLSATVSENRQPYFDSWKNNFRPLFKNIPLFFWLFFIGSILLFYDSIKKINKGKILLTLSYAIFLLALIFSRHSPSSIMNGTGLISKFVYFSGFLFFILSAVYLYYSYFKNKKTGELKRINSSYLLLIAFFVISVLGARSAERLIMILSVPASAMVGYLSVAVVKKARENKNETWKFVFIALAIIVVATGLYSFYFNYNVAIKTVKNSIPIAYMQQWQKAMGWVRENTQENSVFAHWWDYGYWIQTIGERATILDGGNGIDYWDHLLGRHVLTGQNEKEALEFLYAHNATHFLIDSGDIGKYEAYSSIGSDENYDRNSQMGIYYKSEKLEKEENKTAYLYKGVLFLDEDYLLEENGKKDFLPEGKAGIAGVVLEINEKGELEQPQVIFVYQGKQYNLGLKCVYYKNKKYDFGTGYKGCFFVVPALVIQNDRMFLDDIGIGLFFTERAMRALWVKLYFFNEGENFKLVHSEETPIIKRLKDDGFKITGDYVYYGETQGPLKIWEINYPKDIEFKQEYLETSYPNESLRIAKPRY